MTENAREKIASALKKPASMALVELEIHKASAELLGAAYDMESAGKCRWQVLNQIKLWKAEIKGQGSRVMSHES